MDVEGTPQDQDQDQPRPQPVDDDATPQPVHIHIPTSPPGDGNGVVGHDVTRPLSFATDRQLPNLPPEAHSGPSHFHSDNFERASSPRHTRNRDGQVRMSSRRQTLASAIGLPVAPPNASGIDWIVPVSEKDSATRRTIGQRLQPTIDNAAAERDKYARKALVTGYALNIAIGLQVLLGALTTGVAAIVTTTRQARISTALLGGLATLVASYLARARGSGEPDLSVTRTKDLEHFLRESRAFQLDHAHEYPSIENGLSERLDDFRHRFEELLGNASGERRHSPVGITPTQNVP